MAFVKAQGLCNFHGRCPEGERESSMTAREGRRGEKFNTSFRGMGGGGGGDSAHASSPGGGLSGGDFGVHGKTGP